MTAPHHDPMVVVLFYKDSDVVSLKQQAAKYLGDVADVEYRELSTSQLDELSWTLNSTKCGVFLVPHPITEAIDSLNVERLAHLRCPAMLVP
jgi:hypothetical protein